MLSSLFSLLPSPLPSSLSAMLRNRRPLEAALHQHTATVTFTPEGAITEASPLFLAAVGYREAAITLPAPTPTLADTPRRRILRAKRGCPDHP